MSQAYYGGFGHARDSVKFNSFNTEYILGDTGYRKMMRRTLDMEAKIIDVSQSAIFATRDAMGTAYSVDGQTFVMYDDFGNVIWLLDSSVALGGVSVVKPVSFSAIEGSHGVNWLKCNIVLQADYLQPLSGNQYLTFQESLAFSGRGGPLKVKRLPAVGKPFKQNVSTNSWFYCVQSGSLTTTSPRPEPPPCIAPDLLDGTEDDAAITRISPVTMRGSPVEYGVQWSYKMSSPDPINGYPHEY